MYFMISKCVVCVDISFANILLNCMFSPSRFPLPVEPHMPHDPMAGGYNPELGMPPNQFPPEPPHDGYDGGASTDEPPSSGRRSNDTLEQPVILGIVLGALLLALAVLMAMCWWKQQQQKRRNLASNPQKFQDQSQCIYADASGHSKPNGGLYPPINGGPHMANGHGPPQDSGGHPRHGCMNIDVNPLAEYDMQTSVHGDRRPPQFYGNGLSGNSKRYGGNHSHENLTSCSGGGGGGGGKSHLQCNGGGDMAYMEQGSGGGVYPMQHRTLPLAPSQPLTTFYADSGSNSLGRPSLNHEYSEPGEREMMTATSSGIPRSSPGLPPHHHHLHQSSSSAASYNGKLSSGGGSERGGGGGGLNNMMVGHRPHHAAEYDYDWSAGNSYDQPRGGGLGAGGVGGETTGALGVSSSLSQDRLPPTYHTASDFGGGSNNNINNNNNNNNNSGHMLYPPPPPPHLSSLSQQQQQLQQPSQRLTTSVSSSGSSRGHPVSAPSYPARPGLPHGGEVESRGGGGGGGGDRGGKQRRRRKRPPSRDIPPREYVMKDQATNTDLSSNEGTFEFTSYCKSGSSSNSGSEVGANGCDSNFGNNGSLESIEDSAQSASSAESDEFEPLRVTHRSVPL
ncbi:uncharacterized protein DDB_G0283357 [Aplysia californica]|uniref:Uncharacterized protein DDB_G0283357 n=1 Tax=Aplysia californica TaxID=6500 RepID=A0ABM1ACY3_APLCA|nr:uncharacterized protein DDB_G0283357 [Aplysia californica]